MFHTLLRATYSLDPNYGAGNMRREGIFDILINFKSEIFLQNLESIFLQKIIWNKACFINVIYNWTTN